MTLPEKCPSCGATHPNDLRVVNELKWKCRDEWHIEKLHERKVERHGPDYRLNK